MTVFEQAIERVSIVEKLIDAEKVRFWTVHTSRSFRGIELLKKAVSQLWMDTASNHQQFKVHELCTVYALLERAEKRVNSMFALFFASEN